ncbi:MAG TPA: hypothetical protein GX710_06750 [Clostridiales bacterium]|nr:hypothetical protein [Clostridiales bacterium]
MIKGVNKKIVEINNPKSLYFEKAILYIRPSMSDIPAKLLSQEAQNYLKSIFPPEKKNKLYSLRIVLISVSIIAVVGVACLLFAKLA